MKDRTQNFMIAKVNATLIAVALCFSVLGIQSAGLVHSVLHANQEQRLQSHHSFDEIEKSFSSDPQKSNLVCKLLDSLLLGASAVTEPTHSIFFSFSHTPPLTVIQTSFVLFKFWSYQSQAPPQSDFL